MHGGEVAVGPGDVARRGELVRSMLARAAVAGVVAHAAFLPISIAGMQIGLAVAGGAAAVLWALGERPPLARLALPVLLLAGAAVASIGLAWLAGMPPRSGAVFHWRYLLTPLAVALALEAGAPGRDPAVPRRRALLVIAVWSATALAPSLFAWVQVRTGIDPMHALGLRPNSLPPPHRLPFAPGYPDRFPVVGFFSWYTRLAHALTPIAILAGTLAALAPLARRTRALLGSAALATGAAVVLTGARSAWAGLALAALTVAAASVAPRVRRLALAGSLAGALAAAPIVPAAWRWLEESRSTAGGNGRATIWAVCTDVIRDHPLTGVGYGALPRWAAPYWDRRDPDFGVQAWCHDALLTAVAEGGPLLGGALVAWFALVAAAFARWRWEGDALARAGAVAGLAVLVALAVNSLVHDVFWSSEPALAFGCAIGVAAVLARPRGDPHASGAPRRPYALEPRA